MTYVTEKDVLDAIERHVATLHPDVATRPEFLRIARAGLDSIARGAAENSKAATLLALDVAKLFVTIGLAIFVAIATMVNNARAGGLAWDSPTIVLFAGAALAILASMIQGVRAISDVYRRADGREGGDAPASPWGTAAIKGKLNGQAGLGLVSIVMVFGGYASWAGA